MRAPGPTRLLAACLVAALAVAPMLFSVQAAAAALCPVHARLADRPASAPADAPDHAHHAAGHHAIDRAQPAADLPADEPTAPAHPYSKFGFACCAAHAVALLALDPVFSRSAIAGRLEPAIADALMAALPSGADPPPRIRL
jgi:hypothetical protein